MKHIWVVESSGGRKWRPLGNLTAVAFYTKKDARRAMLNNEKFSPGLRWRVAKYARVGGDK
jgi:hypothetical protein